MRNHLKLLLAGLAMTAAPVSAATYVFDFNATNTLAGGSSIGNSRSYALTVGGQTVRLRASAWSWTGSTIQSAILGSYGANGLGVIAGDDNGGAGNQHTVDNEAQKDFILLQFDQAVQLNGARLTPFAINGLSYLDNDATIGRSTTIGAGAAWNAVPAGLNGTATTNLANQFQTLTGSAGDGAASSIARTFGTNGALGQVWMVSAALTNPDSRFDSFKFNNLSVTAGVPEPGQWAMFIGGFGLVGATVRRRRERLVAA